MKVKEESGKVGLKLNIQKTKSTTFGPITSWEIDMETVLDFILGGSKITADGDCSHEIKRHLLLGRKAMTNMKVKVKSLSRVRLFATPWTVAYPALSPGKSHGRRSLIIVSPSICHEMMGPDAVILVF